MSVPNFSAGKALEEALRLLQSGNAAGAAALLEQEIQANPHNGTAFQYLGVARSQMGDVGGGIMALREASRLMPRNAGVLYNLGVSLAQAKQADEARSALERSLALDPTNSRARMALERLGFTPSGPRPNGPLGGLDLGLDVYLPMPPPAPSIPIASAPMPIASPPVLSYGPVLSSLSYGNNPIEPVVVPVRSVPAFDTNSIGYVPPAEFAARIKGREPSAGERILRGALWGALFGQWWTLWTVFWDIIMYGSMAGKMSTGMAVILSIMAALAFAVLGSLTGIIIGALNADDEGGTMIGIGAGIVCLVAETMLQGGINFGTLFNVLFWGSTGRFVGRNIGFKVQELMDI